MKINKDCRRRNFVILKGSFRILQDRASQRTQIETEISDSRIPFSNIIKPIIESQVSYETDFFRASNFVHFKHVAENLASF